MNRPYSMTLGDGGVSTTLFELLQSGSGRFHHEDKLNRATWD